MLVVIFLIVILATLAVAIVPRFQEQARAARGADQLQGWLLIAKMRAKREGHPVGLRLQVPIVAHATGPINAVPNVPVAANLDAVMGTSGYGDFWRIQQYSWLVVADNDAGLNAEVVQVRSVAGTTIQAVFAYTHNNAASKPAVRLLGHVTTLQYIEQPDDLVITWKDETGSTTTRPLIVQNKTAVLQPWPQTPPPVPNPAPPDFSGGFSQAQQDQWPVQPGDFLELYGGGQVHQITSWPTQVAPGPPGYPAQPAYIGQLSLYSAVPNTTTALTTHQWRIIRSPRVLKGEADLAMPQGVIVDVGTNYASGLGTDKVWGNQLPVDPRMGNIDILFSPAGAVVSRGPMGSSIILWVRDIGQGESSQTYQFNTTYGFNDPNNPVYLGSPTLVTVYTATGFIAAHPVDVSGAVNNNNPYTFTQDGRSSGL
jgi:hypothetical protein